MPLGSQPPWPDSVETADDYLIWVNTITVAYISKTSEVVPPLTDSTPRIDHVLWNQIRKDKLSADSPLLKMDRTFRFGRIPLAGIIPKNDDIIVDDYGIRWRVMLVENLSFGNEFRVHTVKSTKQPNVAVE
jgi:hypothetical protein